MLQRLIIYAVLPVLGSLCLSLPSSGSGCLQAQEKEEFVERYDRRFAKQDPAVGTSVDELSAFDENGEEFLLDDTRGKYRVLVFGCLT